MFRIRIEFAKECIYKSSETERSTLEEAMEIVYHDIRHIDHLITKIIIEKDENYSLDTDNLKIVI